MKAIGASTAARLIIRLRLQRLRNILRSGFGRRGVARSGTPDKAKAGSGISILVMLALLAASGNASRGIIEQLIDALSFQGDTTLLTAPGSLFAQPVLDGFGLQISLLLVATFLINLASRELAQSDWDVEWLLTLPVPLRTLLAVRIAERTLVNPTALFLVWPFVTFLALRCELGWWSPFLGLLLTWALVAMTTVLRTIVDTGLRLWLAPPSLRNLQAVMSIAALAPLFLSILGGDVSAGPVGSWARTAPELFAWSPPGLVATALASTEVSDALSRVAVLLVQLALIVGLGLAVLSRQLKFGVVNAGVRETGRVPAEVPSAKEQGGTQAGARRWLTAVQSRELRLLGRDRNFLVQTLLVPVVMIAMQFVLNRGDGLQGLLAAQPSHVAAIGFGVAAYSLMFSAFQTLNAEGHALWLLFTVPRRLEDILKEKALLWCAIASIYPLGLFAFRSAAGTAGVDGEFIGLAIIALAGVPVFAVIATSLGVFGSDPLAQEVQRRVRPSYLYMFMGLAGLYTFAIYASSVWQRIGAIVLLVLFALALWQKARDHLPFLLDPAASPPSSVSVADGLIAAMIFFVVQAVAAFFFVITLEGEFGKALLVAFSVAGAIAFAVLRIAYFRLKTVDVPRFFGPGAWVALGGAVVGGAIAAGIALSYLAAVRRFGLFPEALESTTIDVRGSAPWIFALAVFAAPLFEEFIFRGLIFGGLRRLVGLPAAALASAAIFAIVHPPVSVVPVFVLGVFAAVAYDRTRLLIVPIAVHAVYNAIVVGFQSLPA